MTSKTLFLSLDTDAWVQTPLKVADYLISHFFLAEHDQTSLFKGQVASFPWLIMRHQNEIQQLCTETERTLSGLFSHYFSDVEVQVTEKSIDGSLTKKGITLFLVFTDTKGVKHNIANIVSYDGYKVTEIAAVIGGS